MRFNLTSGDSIEVTTVAERPQLAKAAFDAGEWGEFMRHNRIADAFFWRSVETFPDLCLIATAGDGSVVADAHAVRFAFGGTRRDELPPGGWEQTVVWAFADADKGVATNTACALNISVAATMQGRGLARLMLHCLREAVRAAGLRTLVAPVRPTMKSREPRTPMAEYVARIREDGLPADPWLRTHVRLGGQIVGVTPVSWVVAGSLAQWRAWTGLPFNETGEIEVAGALAPVRCDIDTDHAAYIEPNVWVRHVVDGERSA